MDNCRSVTMVLHNGGVNIHFDDGSQDRLEQSTLANAVRWLLGEREPSDVFGMIGDIESKVTIFLRSRS